MNRTSVPQAPVTDESVRSEPETPIRSDQLFIRLGCHPGSGSVLTSKIRERASSLTNLTTFSPCGSVALSGPNGNAAGCASRVVPPALIALLAGSARYSQASAGRDGLPTRRL